MLGVLIFAALGVLLIVQGTRRPPERRHVAAVQYAVGGAVLALAAVVLLSRL